jgi:putative transposase
LGNIVKGFKSATTVKINHHRQTPGVAVWQRGYYDHIIRNEQDLTRIREYIQNNPFQWDNDELNPNKII